MMLKNEIEFWENNLVCPECKGKINVINSFLICKKCSSSHPIKDNVPSFVDYALTEHQKSELQYYLIRKAKIRSKNNYYNQNENYYKWAIKWINNKTVNKNTKIICIGGSFNDDIPHVQSSFKFNIDHLAHRFIKIFPEIKDSKIKYIASKSEKIPFSDDYADIIYSRNSLDHVNNPIITLLEINRVLKKEGKFFLSVYYNKNFINSHESTSIDNDFVENHLKNIFDLEWIKIIPSESEGAPQPPIFSLPNGKRLEWLYAVLKKKKIECLYDDNVLEKYENLTSNFQNAIYYEKKGNNIKASEFYFKVINSKPFLLSDKSRIMYSKVHYYALTDKKELKTFFNEFKMSNKDPFWWKIIIDSSFSLIKKDLTKSIHEFLSPKLQCYFERYIKIKKYKWMTINGFNYKLVDHFFLKFPSKIQSYYYKLINMIR